MRMNLKTLTLLLITILVIQCNKQVKYKLPKRSVEFEVVDKAIKTELDLTPITDFYPISGTDLSVSLEF
jgi:hypothetical protein